MSNCYAIYKSNRDSKIGIKLLDRNNVSRRDVSTIGLFLEIDSLKRKAREASLLLTRGIYIYRVLNLIHEMHYHTVDPNYVLRGYSIYVIYFCYLFFCLLVLFSQLN